MKEDLIKAFEDFYQDLNTLIPKLLIAIAVMLIFIIMGRLFNRSVGKKMQQRWKDSVVSNFLAVTTKWFFYCFGLIIALNIVGFGGIAGSILAGAGVTAIIFGFAFKDLGENFLSGILLALNRPFKIGDIIEVESHRGTVTGLDLRSTHIRNVEGKDIFIPNSTIIKNPLINYTKDNMLRMSFLIGIAPESDIKFVQSICIDYLNQSNDIMKQPLPTVIVENIGEFTIDLNVLFWVDIFQNKKRADTLLGNSIRSKMIREIKELLDQHNISMPSQVLEHKMYAGESLNIQQTNNSKDS